MASGPAELEAEVQRDPKMRRFYELAREYQRLGRIDEAVVLCEKGLQLNPNQWQARNLLAQIFLAKGRFDEARVQVERVLLALPDNIPANHLAADLYFALGDKARALRHYQVVDLFDPGRANVSERIQELAGEEMVSAVPPPDLGEPLPSIEGALQAPPAAVSPAEPPAEAAEAPEAEPVPAEAAAPVFGEESKADDWGAAGDQDTDLLEVLSTEPPPPTGEALPLPAAESWADVSPEPESSEIDSVPEALPAEDTDRAETLLEAEDTQEAPAPHDDSEDLAGLSDSTPEVAGPAFNTVTLAQLYESQGYPEKAVEVYQRILLKEPDNAEVRERIRGLMRRMAGEVPEAPAVHEEDVRKAVRQKRIAVLQNWLTRVREASHV
jgi:tetratricopeptide (TPR) repeat protein